MGLRLEVTPTIILNRETIQMKKKYYQINKIIEAAYATKIVIFLFIILIPVMIRLSSYIHSIL
jgi:hypothetical protein